MQESNYIFVYGTLMRSFSHPMHNVLTKFANFVSEAKVNGRLYEIDGYPGLILTKEKIFVEGELYKINDKKRLFDLLDIYEECSSEFPKPHEYKRVIANTFLSDGNTINAWLYVYNHSVDPAKLIKSGNYRLKNSF